MYKKILSALMLLCTACAHSMNPLFQAIASDSLYAVTQIVSDNHSLLESLNESGETPLLNAAHHNQNYIAKHLARAGANVNASVNGRTALHYAALHQNNDLAEVLIYYGASLDSVDLENGFTPLHYAAKFEANQVATILCEKEAKVNIKNFNEMTPLETACQEANSLPIVKVFLTYDSNRSPNLITLALQKIPTL